MNRSPLVYAILLAGTLAWAWNVRDAEAPADQAKAVEVLPGKPDDLAEVTYHSDAVDLTIKAYEDGHGRYAWADVVPSAATPPEPPDPAEGQPPPPPAAAKPESFKIGKNGEKALEGLAPFKAKRVLEGLADHQLADIGLDPAKATLTITRQGKEPKTYEVSTEGFGGVNAYVRDPATGTVYVVDNKALMPISTGWATLADRALFGGERKDIVSVAVSDGNTEARFTQQNADDPNATYWSTEGEVDSNPGAAAWLDKALGLKSSRFIAEDEAPRDLSPAFSFRVEVRGAEPVNVQVSRGFDAVGQESWVAKSEHTRGLVQLHRSLAAETAADLPSALGGEAVVPPAPAGDAPATTPEPTEPSAPKGPSGAVPAGHAPPHGQAPGGEMPPADPAP